jgi:hypothetical protein
VSTVAIQRSVQATSSDVALLQQTVEAFNLSLQAERFDIDSHLDQFIEKPWGYEYRVYADNFYDLWKLCLLPGRATSLHCHPRKETALLCLKGQAHVQLLEHVLAPGVY